MTLYELKQRYETIEAALQDLDASEETIRAALMAATESADVAEVFEQAGWTLKKLDARKEAQKAAIVHISGEIKKLEARDALIRGMLENAMMLSGTDKVNSGVWRFERRGTTSVDANIELVPDAYVRTVIERKPDLKAIKEAIIGGEEIPGASLKTNYHVRVS
jgi:hypothetical protein